MYMFNNYINTYLALSQTRITEAIIYIRIFR